MVSNKNPLEDAEVKQLLADAKSKLGTRHDFEDWQASFLRRFYEFLDTDESDKAQAAYVHFSKSSKSLIKLVKRLQKHIDAGTISETRVSVKGRNSMSELKVILDRLVDELAKIMPTTMAESQELGFSKYAMAAILVRDGFTEYAVMEYCRVLLKLLRVAALDKAAGPTILDQVDHFGDKFDVFCGVMASLNMLEVAELTTELLHKDMHDECIRLKEETQKLKGEKNLEASSHHEVRAPRKVKQWQRPSKDDKPLEEENSFGGDEEDDATISSYETISTYETIGYEDVESISSYESIEDVETVSSYEDVLQDEESSYETIRVDYPSDYETVQEEIEVSDYESVEASSDEDSQTKRDRQGYDYTNRMGSPKKESRGSLASPSKKDSAATPADKKKAKAAKAAAARRRKEKEKEAAKPKPMPKKLPMDPRFANVEKEWKKEQEARKRNKAKGKNKNKQEEEEQQQKKEEEEENSENPDDANESEEEDGKDGGGGKGKDGAKAKGAGAAPKAKAKPKPDANTQPVQRIQWTGKDYYHGQKNNDDCFNEWKKYKNKRPERPPGRSTAKPVTDDDTSTSSKSDDASEDCRAIVPVEKKKIPKARVKKRVVHTEIITKHKKVADAHTETIRRKKDKPPPKVIRVRHTHQVVKKIHVKKDKPKPEPKKIRVKKEKRVKKVKQ